MGIPTARRGSDEGFSLVELLVVMVIIALLAAIAVPLYLSHQSKAKDAAAQSDAMNLGLFIRAAWEEGDGVTSVTHDGEAYVVDGERVFGSSPGVELVSYSGSSNENWCVELRHPGGEKSNDPAVRFDAQNGYVEQAECP